MERIDTDVLIAGSGLAGILTALRLADVGLSVVLASKGSLFDSNTRNAQGGLAAVALPDSPDSCASHIADTLEAGCGLCNPLVVETTVSAGHLLVEHLCQLGVSFDRDDKGRFDLASEGGHSLPRVLHARDATGRAITDVLIERVRARGRIRILEQAFIADLLICDGTVCGAIAKIGQSNVQINARHTVLATGGAGQVFSRTSNPEIATGDGIALAWRVGARLVDMEFVQFHPTVLSKPGAPALLISEAVRGAGAHLIDGNGKRFLFRYDSRGELATRDIVSRAIAATMRAESVSCVWLDLRPIGWRRIRQRFPNIASALAGLNIDLASEPVPVSPAAHYFMGGVWTDLVGRTTIQGLYAVGECAATGFHGANRLASNSLLEAGVMGLRLADYLIGRPEGSFMPGGRLSKVERPLVPAGFALRDFQRQMYDWAGIARTDCELKQILDRQAGQNVSLDPAKDSSESLQAANIFLVGNLIARAALFRQESVGAHFRVDFPARAAARPERLLLTQAGIAWLPVGAESDGAARAVAAQVGFGAEIEEPAFRQPVEASRR